MHGRKLENHIKAIEHNNACNKMNRSNLTCKQQDTNFHWSLHIVSNKIPCNLLLSDPNIIYFSLPYQIQFENVPATFLYFLWAGQAQRKFDRPAAP